MHWPLWAADREGDEHAGVVPEFLWDHHRGTDLSRTGQRAQCRVSESVGQSTGSLWLSWVRASCALCLPVFEYGLFALDRAGDLGPKASRQWRPFRRARS